MMPKAYIDKHLGNLETRYQLEFSPSGGRRQWWVGYTRDAWYNWKQKPTSTRIYEAIAKCVKYNKLPKEVKHRLVKVEKTVV